MPRLYLVRHGQATAGWADDHDPGLSELGRQQAEQAAAHLASVGPHPIWSSPLRRTQETAAALATTWGCEPQVVDEVRELPSPTDDLAGRAEWLRMGLAAKWPAMGEQQRAWRDGLLVRLALVETDTVVFTHFVVVNAVIGAASGQDAVVVFRPDNGSITIVDTDEGRFRIVQLGNQAQSQVR